MIFAVTFERIMNRSPTLAAAIYGGVVALLVGLTCVALVDVYSVQRATAEAADLLDQLQGRKGADPVAGGEMSGAPFLDGPTVTVAGASLLQRVSGAITKARATIQSSQVEVVGSEDGQVKLVVSFELEQQALQQLLYDLEAGMPFLFIDQLDIQVPQAMAATDGVGRMRVLLAVSGQWQRAIK
jgi:general secretion pathway protein M